MSWLDYDPWNSALKSAPCLALGRNSIRGGGSGDPGGGGGGVGQNSGRISFTACLSPENQNILDITLSFYPSLPDINKTYRLFEDRIFINNYPVSIIPQNDYPFVIHSSSKMIFKFQVNAGAILPDWFSTNVLNIVLFLNEAVHYMERAKIVYHSTYLYNKGPSKPPVSIRVDGNKAILSFKGLPGTSCGCYSDCIPSTGLTILCKDEPFEIEQEITTSDDQCMQFSFVFTDANGNQNNFTVPVVSKVIPLKPFLTLKAPKPNRRNIVCVSFLSHTLRDLYDCLDSYQIEKYIGTEKNREIFSDWKPVLSNKKGTIISDAEGTHMDDHIKTGVKYGYRVRYKGVYGDFTEWSDWTTITPTQLSEDNQNDNAVV